MCIFFLLRTKQGCCNLNLDPSYLCWLTELFFIQNIQALILNYKFADYITFVCTICYKKEYSVLVNAHLFSMFYYYYNRTKILGNYLARSENFRFGFVDQSYSAMWEIYSVKFEIRWIFRKKKKV